MLKGQNGKNKENPIQDIRDCENRAHNYLPVS